ncbi:unnamed protein product, partial [Adineta ricciae]
MSSAEVQQSERLPMLTSTDEVIHSNPVAPTPVVTESTTVTVVKKIVDPNIPVEDNNKFIQVIRPLLVEL